jgi:hypothetical protein
MLNDMVAAFTASSKIGEAMQKQNQKNSDVGTINPEPNNPETPETPEEPETPEFGEFESE